MRVAGRVAIGVVALAALAILAALAYRSVLQHRIAREVRIATPNGIDEAKYIDIDGAEEWITLRGEDRKSPVILFLHGGPSEANSPFVPLYLPYERHYVFVQWDQPGAGMTYVKAGDHQPALTLDGMVRDGIAVAEYVRNELHQPRIILIGQDWGGMLGLRMIEKRPDLFSALVGTGQIIGMLAEQQVQYRYALAHASANHDQRMLAALKQVGPPPYRTLERYGEFQDCCRNPFWSADTVAGIKRLRALLMLTPSLSMSQMFGWYEALRTNEVKLDEASMLMGDLRDTDTDFSVPVFFIQGANDVVTPTSLVADYTARLRAPAKGVDIVPDAGHFVMWTRPQAFLRCLEADLHAIPTVSAAAPQADRTP